jgi:hypothetical protein
LKSGTVTWVVGALGLASLAPLGLVPETLVGVKRLLTGRENELCTAIRALQKPILVLHLGLHDPARVAGWAASSHQPDSIEDPFHTPTGSPARPVRSRLVITKVVNV